MSLDFFPSIPTSAIVAATAAVISYIAFNRRRRYKLPPGPPALPIFGNVLQLDSKKHIHEQFTEWSKIYGPVLTFKDGMMTIVVLNRIDVVLEAMVKKQADFAGRPQTYSTLALTEGGKDIAFGQYGPTWRLHRKLATKSLRYYMSGQDKLESRIKEPISYVIEELKKEKEPFDPYFHISLITVNIICGLCFGKSYSLDSSTFRQIIEWMDVFFMGGAEGFAEDRWPLLKYWPTKTFQLYMKTNGEFLAYLYKHLYHHKQTFSRDNIRDLTDTILLAQKEAEEEGDTEVMSHITDAHVNQTLGDMFSAGVDTSRVTLYWAILFLAVHQDVQAKVHQELDEVLDGDNLPRISDRNRMPYTEATLYECMRLGNVAPIGLAHETICDTTVGGYDIPKGTTVYINHWALHHDFDQWRDAETFKPERFLDDNGKMAPKPESFLPFSAGRRVCLGETVAKPELHLILAALMRKFKVSLPRDVKVDYRPDMKMPGQPKRYEIIMEERN